jgi:hypothetical protein
MKRELFIPYKLFLLRIIRSAETKDQLIVCHNMIDRYCEVFRGMVTPFDLNDANIELMNALQAMHNSETII